MLLAGDIGGTKTNLAFFEDQGDFSFTKLSTFPSQKYSSLKDIIEEFLQRNSPSSSIQMACFAIAGPIKAGICKTTNLPWIVNAQELSEKLGIPKVYLINDLEANAYAVDILSSENLLNIFPGVNDQGNRAVVSPGTGLGEAGLYWDGKKHHPFACEGGHCEFGPRNELQIDLCRYLYKRFGHASYERVLSGPGLHNIYSFFRDEMDRKEPEWLAEQMLHEDPAKAITENALNGKSDLCEDSLNLFVSILGAEASNCALKFMAFGGVYLGGGIPPKILPKLQERSFKEGFTDKGRFKELLEEIPIYVILDDKASLKGAASYCRRSLTYTISEK